MIINHGIPYTNQFCLTILSQIGAFAFKILCLFVVAASYNNNVQCARIKFHIFEIIHEICKNLVACIKTRIWYVYNVKNLLLDTRIHLCVLINIRKLLSHILTVLLVNLVISQLYSNNDCEFAHLTFCCRNNINK